MPFVEFIRHGYLFFRNFVFTIFLWYFLRSMLFDTMVYNKSYPTPSLGPDYGPQWVIAHFRLRREAPYNNHRQNNIQM
jgi:hypothetical protein